MSVLELAEAAANPNPMILPLIAANLCISVRSNSIDAASLYALVYHLTPGLDTGVSDPLAARGFSDHVSDPTTRPNRGLSHTNSHTRHSQARKHRLHLEALVHPLSIIYLATHPQHHQRHSMHEHPQAGPDTTFPPAT